MASGRALGAGGIAGENEAEDLLVLGPDQRALLEIVEHGAHRAFQMWPLRRDGVFDRTVAGQAIERRVKGDVGLDKRQHWRIRSQREAGSKCPPRGAALRHVDHPPGDALGGEPRGQRVERSADLVKFANSVGVDPGDDQPAAAVFFDQLLLLEQLQRVADWLPRHAERTAQLLLADALPGDERAASTNCS